MKNGRLIALFAIVWTLPLGDNTRIDSMGDIKLPIPAGLKRISDELRADMRARGYDKLVSRRVASKKIGCPYWGDSVCKIPWNPPS